MARTQKSLQIALILLGGLLTRGISTARADQPIGDFIDRQTGVTPRELRGGYEYARNSSRVQSDIYRVIDEKFDVSVPVAQEWVASPSLKAKSVVSNAHIPGTNRTVPTSLLDAHLTADYKYTLAGSSGLGFTLVAGSASDKPFANSDNAFYDGTAYFSIGAEPRTTVIVFLNISSLRPYLSKIPLPGVSYGLRLSPHWGVNLGFPHVGLWAEPASWLRLDLSAEPVAIFEARVGIAITQLYSFQLTGESNQEVYKRAGRAATDEFMIFSDRLLGLAFRQNYRFINIDLGAGYILERRVLETNNYLRDRGLGSLDPSKSWAFRLNTRISL